MALSHVSEWTPWMVQFMTSTLGGHDSRLQHGRAPCSPEERALGKVRSCVCGLGCVAPRAD